MISRRNFIRMLGVAGVSSSVLCITRDGEAAVQAGIRKFAYKLATEGQAEEIGRTYLSLHAEENDPDRLLREVMDALPDLPWWGSQQSLERGIRSSIDQDYLENRIESVHGWLLSKTELRLCAISAADSRVGRQI